jgi:serine/threonine protein kinase
MATVFLAQDPRFKREVAVKVLPRQFTHDPQFRVRFEREAQTIARLDHSAIVPVFDYGEEDQQPYLVMRYMPGGSLSERLQSGPLPLTEAAAILNRIAGALDRAHSLGIVHRDLKPANILFDQYGDAFLADFGIVKVAQATSTLTGSAIIGTPAYMSPEQVQGTAVGAKSDIYTLGVILFEMLTGKQPYAADTPMGMAVKHIIDPVPRILDTRADLPPALDTVISCAMAKEADKRYSTATDLAAQLAAEIQKRPAPPPFVPPSPTPPPQDNVQGFTDVIEEEIISPSPVRDNVREQVAPAAAAPPQKDEPADSLTRMVDDVVAPPPPVPVADAIVKPPRIPAPQADSLARRTAVPFWLWGFLALFLVGVGLLSWRLFAGVQEHAAPEGTSASGFIEGGWAIGFRVSSLAYGDGVWSVLMSQGGVYGRQRWETRAEFPADTVQNGWEDGFRVTDLTYGDGVWGVLISQDTPYGRQIWTTSRDFPAEYIQENWEAAFHVTELAYGDGVWAIVMSQGGAYGRQIWETSQEFPGDTISAGWDEAFRVTDLAYGDGVWGIVMSQDTPYGRQIWTTARAFPADYIQENWQAGFRVTELTYGDGVWAIVMSQESPFGRQIWQNAREFASGE